MNFREILSSLDKDKIEEIKKMISDIERNREIRPFINKLKNIRNSKPFIDKLKEINKVKFIDLTDFIEESEINSVDPLFDSLDSYKDKEHSSGNQVNDDDDLITLPALVTRCSLITLSEPLLKNSTLTSLKNLDYINTSKYGRDNNNTLLPLDFIQFHNNDLDLGIFCIEVYNTNLEIVESCPLKISDNDGNSIEVGDSLIDDENDDNNDDNNDDDDDEKNSYLSTVKDTNGNVYTIKSRVRLNDIKDYLEVNNKIYKKIEPTNLSKFSHLNSNNTGYTEVNNAFNERLNKIKVKNSFHLPNKDNDSFCSFKCYIKGFFVSNWYSTKKNGEEIVEDTDEYHTNMIWLEQLTLVEVTASNDKTRIEQIKIGDFINVTYNDQNNDQNNNYNLYVKNIYKTNTEAESEAESYSCLPVKSNFILPSDTNINSDNYLELNEIEYSILSVKNYFQNN